MRYLPNGGNRLRSCESVSDALDVASGDETLKGPTPEEFVCVFRQTGYDVALRMAQSAPGVGDWSAVELGMRARLRGRLTVARMRDAPLTALLRRARSDVRDADAGRGSRFATADDLLPPVPETFLEDRRGGTARTDREYAELAYAIVTRWPGVSMAERRRALTARYASPREATWRRHLDTAKVYVDKDSDWLTDDGARLVFGSAEPFASDVRELELAKSLDRLKTPKGQREIRAQGRDVEMVRMELERRQRRLTKRG